MSDPATPQPTNARCPACGAAFRCGIDDDGPCWCAREQPAVLPVPEPGGAGCLCPRCLRAAVAAARQR